nr:uncharacterized protein LOC120347562 isoform X2 [Styela clava]
MDRIWTHVFVQLDLKVTTAMNPTPITLTKCVRYQTRYRNLAMQPLTNVELVLRARNAAQMDAFYPANLLFQIYQPAHQPRIVQEMKFATYWNHRRIFCMCPFGFTGDDCMEKPAGYDDRCPLPDDPVDLCDISGTFDECFAGIPSSMCPDGKICCLRSDGCLFECISIDKKPPPKISKLALIAILMGLKNRPKQTVRRPPIVQVAPYAPYVQAAPHVPYIQAAPHVPFVQVAPAPVPVVQVAPAPVSITPSFTGAACGYGEALIHGCPDVCQSARCMIHDAVICRVHPCNGCTARWYNRQGHDVTASCSHVVG